MLPLLLAGLLLTRGAEEEVEERVAGVAAIALALACCGVDTTPLTALSAASVKSVGALLPCDEVITQSPELRAPQAVKTVIAASAAEIVM